MKIAAVALALTAVLVACRAGVRTHPDTMHITMVDACGDVNAVGVFHGREYLLTRPSGGPLGVACYNPMPDAVGKDLPARFDGDVFTLTTSDGAVRYAVTGPVQEAK